MATYKKWLIGFLILVVLTSSVYIMLPEKVRIDVKNTKTLFSVWEDDKWVLGATEYLNLFDGPKKMRASSRNVTYEVNNNIITITRTAYWKDNIKTIHTYTFDSSISDVELVPVDEKLTCFNCQGKIVHFEYRDILYEGETKDITSPFSFGHNMKLEWQDGAYRTKVYQQKYASDKIIIRYRAESDYEVFDVRLFDPVEMSSAKKISFTDAGDAEKKLSIELEQETYRCLPGCQIKVKVDNSMISKGEIKDFSIRYEDELKQVIEGKKFKEGYNETTYATLDYFRENDLNEFTFDINVPPGTKATKFNITVENAGIKYTLDPEITSGCTESNEVLTCTGELTGNWIDTTNSSIHIYDATIDATTGDYLWINTTHGWINMSENVTVNSYGTFKGTGSHEWDGGNTQNSNDRYGNPVDVYIHLRANDSHNIIINETTFNSYGGAGGNGYPSCTIPDNGNNHYLYGGGHGDSPEFVIYSGSQAIITNSTIDIYGGDGGNSAHWDTVDLARAPTHQSPGGGFGGKGNFTSYIPVSIEETPIDYHGGEGGLGNNCECSGAGSGQTCTISNGGTGGDSVFSVENLNTDFSNISFVGYSGKIGTDGTYLGGCAGSQGPDSDPGNGDSFFTLIGSEINMLLGTIVNANISEGDGVDNDGRSKIYFESDYKLTFTNQTIHGDQPATNYHIINLTNDTVDTIGVFDTDFKQTTYVHCSAPDIVIGNDTTLDTDLDFTNCASYNEDNITWKDYVEYYRGETEISECSEITTSGDYTLTGNIDNADSSTNCINITGENITFDCQGYTIDADDAKDRAINLDKGTSHVDVNVTIQNCVLTNWDTAAIYVDYADNVIVDNVSISDLADYGIYYLKSDNSIINNSDLSLGVNGVGIILDGADSYIIENTVISSSKYGIQEVNYPSGTKYITDVNITSSGIWDFHINSYTGGTCDNTFTNVNGSEGEPIVFFNSAVSLDSWDNNFSEMILCNADNSNLNNITYDGDEDNRRNGIFILGSSGTMLENSSFYDYTQVNIGRDSSNTIIRNNTFNNSDSEGLYLHYANNVQIYDNNFINTDLEAIDINSGCDDNIISNNTFQELTTYAIDISSAANPGHRFYNNLINLSSGDSYIDDGNAAGEDDFNTSVQIGTRIYSDGTQIGGNFYANNTGDGYSETCDDINGDGFCDTQYTGDGNAVDYHPLSDEFDDTPPELTIDSPTTSQALSTSFVEFNISSNEELDYCVVSLDEFVSNETMEEFSTTLFNFTNESMADGSYTANFSCNDTADNWNETEGVSFSVDTVYPEIDITYPTNNTNFSYTNVHVNYTHYDLNEDMCWYTNDSETTNTTIACGTNLTSYDWDEGTNNVVVYINDTAGNENNSGITFIVDTTSPIVSIEYPTAINYTAVTELNYTATDSTLDACWYSLDEGDTNTTNTCNSNVTGLSATEGENIWFVYANDSANRITNDNVTFEIDTTNPEVLITYPPNNTNFSTTDVDINYTYSDINIDECWYTNDSQVTNTTVTCGDNLTTQIWDEGSNMVIIYADDGAGNINQTDITFITDTIDPVVSIEFPANSTYYDYVVTELNFSSSDTGLDSCWYALSDGGTNVSITCNANVTGLSANEGSNNWFAFSNDSLEREGIDNTTFFVDTIYPSVDIEYPTNNTNFSVNTVNVNYSATDTNLGFCWYTNDTGDTNTTVTCNANLTTEVWDEGANNIIIYVNDSAGNENSSDITFNVDITAPTVTIVHPTEGQALSEEDVALNFTTNEVTEWCGYSLDGAANDTSVTGPTNVTLTSLSEASHTIQIWCNDTVGHMGNSGLINFSIINGLSLDGLKEDRNYEYRTSANITSAYDTITVYDDTNRYANQASPFSYLIDLLRQNKFDDDTTSKSISSGSGVTIELGGNDELYNATLNITGTNNPENVTLTYFNDYNLFFPGVLTGRELYQPKICVSGVLYDSYNISFGSAETKLIYINYSNQGDVLNRIGFLNFTMTAFDLDAGNDLSYEENFSNTDLFTGTYGENISLYSPIQDFYDNDSSDWTAGEGGSISIINPLTSDAYLQMKFTSTSNSPSSTTFTDSLTNFDLRKSYQFKTNLSHQYQYSCDQAYEDATGYGGLYLTDGTNTITLWSWSGFFNCYDYPSSWDETQNLDIEGRLNSSTDDVDIYKNGIYQSTKSISSFDDGVRPYLKFTSSLSSSQQLGDANFISYFRLWNISVSGVSLNMINSTYSNVADYNYTSDSLNITQNDIKRATFNWTSYEPTGTQITGYGSNDNQTTWEEVTNGVAHTFTSEGKNISFKPQLETTNETVSPIIYNYKVSIIPAAVSSLNIDIGNDGVDIINYTYELNSTTTPISYTGNDSRLNIYINGSCNETDCLIPIEFISGSGGTIEITGLNLTQDINPITLNTTYITSEIIDLNSTGTITADDLKFDYHGNKNITVGTIDGANEFNRTISVFYSKLNATIFPDNIFYWTPRPDSPTAKNVVPFGQDSNTPFFLFRSESPHPFNIYMRFWNETNPSCTTTWANNESNNTNTYNLHENFTDMGMLNGTNMETNITLWTWTNFSCSSGLTIYEPYFEAKTLCDECVYTETFNDTEVW